jgi:protein TonB
MKQKTIFTMIASLLMLFSSANVFAGTSDELIAASDTSKVYEESEVMPQFPGGESSLMKYLLYNVKYPKEAFKKGIEGKVIVSFIVTQDGSIKDVHAQKAVHPVLDAEAVRVVQSMPKWKPGMQDGKYVNVHYTLPIQFKLTGASK